MYMPKEESFPVPLKCIEVTRTTHTSLDVLLEKNIDDYWNVDGDREFSVRYVDRIHNIHIFETETPRWVNVVRGETDKKTNDLQTC